MSEIQERRDEQVAELRTSDAGAALGGDDGAQAVPSQPVPAVEDASPAGPGVIGEPARPEASSFWECGQGVRALDDPTPLGKENALGRLGKPPFEKSVRSRFRLLGYLATVYEHVSQDVGGTRDE